jgi:hypothetical protein
MSSYWTTSRYHYEEMSPEHKWMSFTWEDGRIGHLNIYLKDGKLETRYEEWSDEIQVV